MNRILFQLSNLFRFQRNARSPFRVFGAAARPACVAAWGRPLMESGARSESAPAEVPSLLLRCSRSAVSPCPGYAVFLQRTAAGDGLGYQPRPLVELDPSSRVLPSCTYPTASAIRSSHGLSLPTAHEGFEVHFSRAKADPLRSAFRVWLPSWRLTPSNPGPVLFRTGSAPGIHPSKVSLPKGIRGLSAGKNPPTVSPAVIPPPKRQTGPTGLGFWVRTFRERLAIARAFRPTTAGTSLGFSPL
jgi:hypothetical protein